jgi:hypothetical protein
MSLNRKAGKDTADRPLQTLPDVPLLSSLSPEDSGMLTEWWMKVRDVLDREDEVLRALLAKVSPSSATASSAENTTVIQSQPTIPASDSGGSGSDAGGGVTREEVIQIVNESIGDSIEDAIANARYTHSQLTPSVEWIVIHDLGWKPSVTVMDSMNNHVWGDVTHDSSVQLRIFFSSAFSGNAYLT